ncbi:hypothetical protein [Schaalia cardiffensis]|uniref:hypothetical protein n=1 Tax=Schaalia cardiffensis TaxID=181487 RepID=UPI002AAF26C8|nr:hypothetical protein [Schaalia cardiffensis]
MSEYWYCTFVGEGTSDDALVKVLGDLILHMRPGADVHIEPFEWIERPKDKSVASKAEKLRDEPFDLIFIHRDTDGKDWEARANEVLSIGDERLVPVIPIRMTEAWALASLWDQEPFQQWCSKKGLSFDVFEKMADPKQMLKEYLSGEGRRLISDKDFSTERARVLEAIEIDGGVKRLKGWKELRKQIDVAMSRVRQHVQYSN